MGRKQFTALSLQAFLGMAMVLLFIVRPAHASPFSLLSSVGGRHSLAQPHPLFPDSAVVFSSSAVGFDVVAYVAQADGYFSDYQQYMNSTGWTSGAEVLARIALENSINPRLILALLEYRCACVLGVPSQKIDGNYLMGVMDPRREGLYRQLGTIVNWLSQGYYGWRSGALHEIRFSDDSTLPLTPSSNAGTVALQYLFAQLYDRAGWERALDPEEGFLALYQRMFGDPWQQPGLIEPPLPEVLVQPLFILPFEVGQLWSYTSGPHKAWETEGALAALDFAPASDRSGCIPSRAWVTAVANGLIVRARHGAVVLDLDGDGLEQTGWTVLYMHIAEHERVAVGVYLHAGERIGHPSCEGGPASGTHLHIARKYNGEWVLADGTVPLVMDGWTAHAGVKPFEGTLTQNNQTITAHPFSSRETYIVRRAENPSPEKRESRNGCE